MSIKIQKIKHGVVRHINSNKYIQGHLQIIKELIENSIDGLATKITISLQKDSSITVVDNGKGIDGTIGEWCSSKEYYLKENTEHETKSFSYGFKGIFLTSLSDISTLKIHTRKEEEKIGREITFRKIDGVHRPFTRPIACQKGTIIYVKNIFNDSLKKGDFNLKKIIELVDIYSKFNKVFFELKQGSKPVYTTNGTNITGYLCNRGYKEIYDSHQTLFEKTIRIGTCRIFYRCLEQRTTFVKKYRNKSQIDPIDLILIDNRPVKCKQLENKIKSLTEVSFMNNQFVIILAGVSYEILSIDKQNVMIEQEFIDSIYQNIIKYFSDQRRIMTRPELTKLPDSFIKKADRASDAAIFHKHDVLNMPSSPVSMLVPDFQPERNFESFDLKLESEMKNNAPIEHAEEFSTKENVSAEYSKGIIQYERDNDSVENFERLRDEKDNDTLDHPEGLKYERDTNLVEHTENLLRYEKKNILSKYSERILQYEKENEHLNGVSNLQTYLTRGYKHEFDSGTDRAMVLNSTDRSLLSSQIIHHNTNVIDTHSPDHHLKPGYKQASTVLVEKTNTSKPKKLKTSPFWADEILYELNADKLSIEYETNHGNGESTEINKVGRDKKLEMDLFQNTNSQLFHSIGVKTRPDLFEEVSSQTVDTDHENTRPEHFETILSSFVDHAPQYENEVSFDDDFEHDALVTISEPKCTFKNQITDGNSLKEQNIDSNPSKEETTPFAHLEKQTHMENVDDPLISLVTAQNITAEHISVNVSNEEHLSSSSYNNLLEDQNQTVQDVEKDVTRSTPRVVLNRSVLSDFTLKKSHFNDLHIIGQFNNGFILTVLQIHTKRDIKENDTHSSDNILILFDQHACDEIYNYERLIRETPVHKQGVLKGFKLKNNFDSLDDQFFSQGIKKENGYLMSIPVIDQTPLQIIEKYSSDTFIDENDNPKDSATQQSSFDCFIPKCCNLKYESNDDCQFGSRNGHTFNGERYEKEEYDDQKNCRCNNEHIKHPCDSQGENHPNDNQEDLQSDNENEEPYKILGSHACNIQGTAKHITRESKNLVENIFRCPTALASEISQYFATKACRISIMIGQKLSRNKMQLVVKRLAKLERPWNCPHGRPTFFILGCF